MARERVLTIDRSKWRKGGENFDHVQGLTKLLNKEGYMCCLGFDALASGIPREVILGRDTPADIVNETEHHVPDDYEITRLCSTHGMPDNSQAVNAAMDANDEYKISEKTREARVRKALIDLGWDDVEFIN